MMKIPVIEGCEYIQSLKSYEEFHNDSILVGANSMNLINEVYSCEISGPEEAQKAIDDLFTSLHKVAMFKKIEGRNPGYGKLVVLDRFGPWISKPGAFDDDKIYVSWYGKVDKISDGFVHITEEVESA